jgi:hypothetical protein
MNQVLGCLLEYLRGSVLTISGIVHAGGGTSLRCPRLLPRPLGSLKGSKCLLALTVGCGFKRLTSSATAAPLVDRRVAPGGPAQAGARSHRPGVVRIGRMRCRMTPRADQWIGFTRTVLFLAEWLPDVQV